MDIRLDGRVALITGGSRGLGYAMAHRFAQSGASVAILARRAEPLEEARKRIADETGARVWAQSCDVADAARIAELFAAIERDLGKVDILVNNAGNSKSGAFESLTDEDWRNDFESKLFAAVRLCRLALPGMKARRWGRILNVLNIGARAPRARGAPTQVTRAAGLALTKVLANDAAPHNVLVNALMTGSIVTDQIVGHWKRENPSVPLESFIAERGKSIPIGRFGTAEEYANVACFLASDAAAYVTGTAINIDGGASPII